MSARSSSVVAKRVGVAREDGAPTMLRGFARRTSEHTPCLRQGATRFIPLSLVLLAACGGPGGIGQRVAPALPTASRALDGDASGTDTAGSGVCPGMPEAPLVVDWPAEKRIDLGTGLAHGSNAGLVVAAVQCPHVRILKTCSVNNPYVFAPAQIARTTLHFEGADDIRANLPFSMGDLALASDAAIDVALAYVGRRTAQLRTVDRSALVGECAGATHFVRSAWIGAFRVASGTRGRAQSFAELSRLGSLDASSSSAKRLLHEDGTLESCESHDASATSPPARCGVPVRIELGAIVAARPQVDASAGTPRRPSVPASKPPASPARRTWYPQPGIGPSFAWVDGSRAILGLVWHREKEAAGVVALDRKTLAERWAAGPFPIRWTSPVARLEVVGDRIALSDDRGDVHILDVNTGAERRVARVEGGIRRSCAATDGSRRLIVIAGRQGGDGEPSFLDVDSGALERADARLACPTKNAPLGDLAAKPVCGPCTNARVPGFRASRTIADGEDRITLGTARAQTRLEAFAIGWHPRTQTPAWQTRLAAPGDVPASTEEAPAVVLSHGRIFHVYETELGTRRYRLVSRSSRTGVLLSSSDVPATSEATLTSVTMEGGDIFVVMGHELHVLDVSTGTWRSMKEL